MRETIRVLTTAELERNTVDNQRKHISKVRITLRKSRRKTRKKLVKIKATYKKLLLKILTFFILSYKTTILGIKFFDCRAKMAEEEEPNKVGTTFSLVRYNNPVLIDRHDEVLGFIQKKFESPTIRLYVAAIFS